MCGILILSCKHGNVFICDDCDDNVSGNESDYSDGESEDCEIINYCYRVSASIMGHVNVICCLQCQ